MFDDDLARGCVLVAECIRFLFPDRARLNENALVRANLRDALLLAADFRAGVQRQIDGVGDQPFLAGAHGVDHALARERFVVEHAETAAVEREAARVRKP